MKNTLQDLNNYLFEAIERIQDDELSPEDLEKEIRRAEVVTKVGDTIIKNSELELKAMQHLCEYGYGYEISQTKKTLPPVPKVFEVKQNE